MKKLILLTTLFLSFSTYSVELKLSDDCVSSLKNWSSTTNKASKRRGLNKVLLKKSCSGIQSAFKVPNNLSFSDFLYKMSSYNFYSKNEDLYLKFHTAMEKKIEEITNASDNKKTIEQSNLIGQVWNKIVLDTEVDKQEFDFLGATCNDGKGSSSNSPVDYLQSFFKDADEQIGKDLWKTTPSGTKECLVSWCNCLDKSDNRVYGAVSYSKCTSSLVTSGGKCSSRSWSFGTKSSKKNLPKFDKICKSKNAVSYALTTDLNSRRSDPQSIKVAIDPSLFAKWAKDNL